MKMKKWISFLLVFLMLLSALPVSVFAADIESDNTLSPSEIENVETPGTEADTPADSEQIDMPPLDQTDDENSTLPGADEAGNSDPSGIEVPEETEIEAVEDITYDVQAEQQDENALVQVLDETPVPAECQLDQLYFSNTWLNPEPDEIYVMEPAFEPAHRNYTMYVPDKEYLVYAYAAFSPEAYIDDTTIQARYTGLDGNETTKDLRAQNLYYSKTDVFTYQTEQNLTGKVMTILVGGKEAYHIQIVRVASLNKITIKQGSKTIARNLDASLTGMNTYQQTVYLNATDDEAFELAVQPTVYSANSTVKINGAEIERSDSGAFDQQTVTLTKEDRTDALGQPFQYAQMTIEVEGNRVESIAGTGLYAQDSTYTFDFYSDGIKSLKVTTPPTTTEYTIGDSFDPAGMVITAEYRSKATKTVPITLCEIQPADGLTPGDTSVTVSYQGQTVTQAITVNMTADLDGAGTQDDPYKLATAADMEKVSNYVSIGYSFEGEYLQLTDNITLPADWTPIGALTTGTYDNNDAGMGRNILPFSGVFDGNGKTLTFGRGSKPLFAFVREAKVYDLSIDAPFMDGYALVNNYAVDYGADGNANTGKGGSYDPGIPDTIDITNVTVKSGSIIKNGGFLGGFASGGNVVNIKDCTIEAGVKIGCNADGTSAQISGTGSFAGGFNGTITNCVSYADVYGTNTVGGIVGYKGQSMGPFTIKNCIFYGSVHASGDTAGGIAGSGYVNSTAPNTPCATITNCIFAGTVEGQKNVGGIIGAEGHLQAWDNGVGNISNNLSTGSITASGTKGGIAGSFSSLNRYTILDNNYYLKTQTNTGIGAVSYVDTSAAAHASGGGTTYINTADKLPDIRGISKRDHNRTDDPLGRDADKLSKAFENEEITDGSVIQYLNNGEHSTRNWIIDENGKPAFSDEMIAYKLTVTGYPETCYIGDELDLTGATFTATMSDESTKPLTLADITVSGYDNTKQNVSHVVLRYETARAEIAIKVIKKTTGDKEQDDITVSFTLLGDSDHGTPAGSSDTHTLKGGNLTTWISKTDYTLDINSTVWDLMQAAAEKNAELTLSNPSGNYVDYITWDGVMLGEFTNGNLSGWMYTLNGKHPTLGVSEQFLSNGDVVVFHYTDDYTVEQGAENWGTKPSTSGGATANTENKTETTLNPEVQVNKKGEANAVIDEKAIDNTIADAKTEQADVIIIAPEVKGNASKVSVELPKSGVDSIAKQTDADLKVETDIADIIIPQKSLNDLAKQSGNKVTISAEAVKDTDSVKLEVAVDGKSVEKLSGGITVSVPAKAGNSGDVLVIVNSDGSETIVKKSIVNGKTVEAVLDGSCTVKVVDNSKHFDDTMNHWSKDAVAFASSHELFGGTSANTFAPDTPMSRAMLATVLYRLEDAVATGNNIFADVPEGTWYTDAVTWASNAGIVTGTGSGFAPNGNVTREQLATMLYRYAKTLGMSTSASGDLSRFSDGSKTSSWAKDAMEWAVGSGLISGKGNGILDPNGSATRAEVAVIMQRLIGLMLN